MSSGVFLGKVLLFCALSSNKCAIREVEDTPHKVTIDLCIENKSNQKLPIITIGVVEMDNQENYVVYTIDRNCRLI